MAERRYQLIHKKNLAAMEDEFTPYGHARLVQVREENPRFKGARIVETIQMLPDEVPLGKTYVPEGV